MRRATTVSVLVMLLASTVTAGILVSHDSLPSSFHHRTNAGAGSASDADVANEPQSMAFDALTPEQQIGRLLSHMPEAVSLEDALGPAAHWLLQEDDLTGTTLAPAPRSLDDVFAKIRQDVAWEPIPVPDVPEGPEPLLTALGEYADVAGVELPDLAVLRAQILSLRMQVEAEDALSQLVRAYNQALQLEAEATQDLTVQERHLMERQPEAVQAWFDADPHRTPADFEVMAAALMGKVDVSDRLRAAELLLRTAEAVKDIISLPPVPFVPGVHDAIDALQSDLDAAGSLPWHGTGDPNWDNLHHLTSLSTTALPTGLPELPPLDLIASLGLFAHVLGIPMEDILTPANMASVQALPPSLADAVATIVTARAFGFLMGDPVLHSRLLLTASQDAEPTLRAWAAVMDLNQVPHGMSVAVDAQGLLRNTLSPSGAGLFAVNTAPQPPSLAVLLEREGLTSKDARTAQESLPIPVALGTAYALDGIQRVNAAREQALAALSPEERDAVDSGSSRVAALLEGRDWSVEEAALVEAWARGMARISPDDLRGMQQAQADALASIEAAAAILAAYAAAPAGGWTLPILPGPTDEAPVPEPEAKVPWHRRVIDFLADFQVIGTASAQTLPAPITQCPNTALSDCQQDVWLQAGGILITGFGSTVVGPEVTGGGTPLLVIDFGGNDEYLLPVATADGGTPVRVALDMGGSDTYRSTAALGQGAADGPGTLAVLWDSDGDDTYTHTCQASVCGAQGYGSAGGLGVLYDGGGADRYEASNSRAHGVGRLVGSLGGTGLLLDRGVGDDVLRAAHGQGYAEGQSSIGILVNDGDQSANHYETTNSLVPRYQGGRSAGDAAVGLLLDLGGLGTTYSNVQVPEGGGWTYMSHDDDPLEGERIRKDDALWLESSPTSGPGLGIDSRRGDDDGDLFDNWVELLAGSDPQDPQSTPEDSLSVASLVETVVALLPDPDDIDPDELVDPDNLPDPDDVDPEDIDPEMVQELLDGYAQRFDVGLCYVSFDEEGACGVRMALLHLGASTDDTIDAPALILIEMGGNDTYTTEVAGPGGFYIYNQSSKVEHQLVEHQRIDGVGSLAIDLAGDDVYQDPGVPTQGAITLSTTPPEMPDANNMPVTVSNDEGDRPTIGYPVPNQQTPPCKNPSGPTLTNSSQWQAYFECMAKEYWVPYATGWDEQRNEVPLNVRNPALSPVSLLLDAAGGDIYEASDYSQGAATTGSCGGNNVSDGLGQKLFQAEGAAWLVDLDGDDNYTGGAASQGAVRYGAGQAGLIDLAGNDTYRFQTQAHSDIVGAINVNQLKVCLPVPLGPKVALVYDGAGSDTYDNNNDAAPEVDPAQLDPMQNAAFLTQGIGRSNFAYPNYVGVFVDDGPEQDTYLARGPSGSEDLSAMKNNVVRPLQNGMSGGGSGTGAGFFLDGPTGPVSPNDHDGDCAPNVLETAAGTNSNDLDDHPGTVWMVLDCGDGEGPMLQLRGRMPTTQSTSVTLPGLVINGHADMVWTESQAFMVSLGGNNTYLGPRTAGIISSTTDKVSFVMDAGNGNTHYLPTCARIENVANTSLDVGAGTDRRCPSLGAARDGVAVLVDGGGDNVFHTNGTLRVRTSLDWDVTLATQGVGLDRGVGALVTWDASNRFTANLTVEVRQTQTQIKTPKVVVRGLAQGAGYAEGYGLLANLGDHNGDDEYVTHLDVATDGPQDVLAMAQGAAYDGIGVLLDGGGNNSFFASHPLAQGAARQPPRTTVGSYVAFAALGILWSGTGDDRFEGREFSQGASQRSGPEGRPLGLLYDAGGNDEYVVVPDASGGPALSQGAAEFGVGLLVDVAGDDRYLAPGAAQVQGAAVSGTGMLLDLGGNDVYMADTHAQAVVSAGSQAPTLGLLVDLHGRDAYILQGSGQGFADEGAVGTYAMFIDAGGDDRYEHGHEKLELADLCEESPCTDGNGWVWRPGADGQAQANGIGIDASSLDAAFTALYAGTGMEVLPLQVVDDDAKDVDAGDTTRGELLVHVRIDTSSSAVADPEGVDRVTVSADGRVLGYALFNDTLSATEENVLVYTYVWNTTSTTLPVAFPDAEYVLRASIYMGGGPVTGSAAPPDLPAAESEPFPLTIDNPPVVWADLPKTLISPGDTLPLQIVLGNDVAWPDGLDDDAARASLCEQWGVEPCLPGALVTFTRTNITDATTQFNEIYFPAGSFTVPITATEGGPWPDGTYRVRLQVKDHGGQLAGDIELPVITVDGTPPTARITTPLFADESHSASGGVALDLHWAFDDPDGSGVAGVCVVQLDEQYQPVSAGKVCREGASLAVDHASFAAQTGDVLRFVIAAVDLAGNTDSPCDLDSDEEEDLAPPHCIADKVSRHSDADPTIRSITVDFNPPQILDVKVDGLEPKDAFLQPGAPMTIMARVSDVGTQIVAPGRVQVLLPVLDADGRLSPNPFVGDMQTDGEGNYWYDEWHLHNEMHVEPRHDELGFTIRATDRAGNLASEGQRLTLDSLPPIVLPEETTTYVQGKGTDEEKRFQAGKPGLLAEVRARVLDAAMDSMRLHVTELTGSAATKPCGRDEASSDPNKWVCPFQLEELPDGDYTVRFNATDRAGNIRDDATSTIHVRASKLTFANITVDQITHDSFRVNWTTPFEGTSQVAFGVSGLLGQFTPVVEGYRPEHSVEVTGLQPSTPYFFHVISENTAGVQSNSTVSPTPVRTLNAYTFELANLTAGQAFRSWLNFGYELHLKTNGPGVRATILVQDAGADADPFELEVATLGHGQGTLAVDTTQFADGQYRVVLKLDRSGDRMEVASPTFRIDNTEPVIALVSPRTASTVSDASPTFVVQLIDPMGNAAPSGSTLVVKLDNQPVQPVIQADDVVGPSSLQRRLAFTLPNPLVQGARELNLSVLDEAGNEGLAKWNFVLDSMPPQRGDVTNVTYHPGPDGAKPGGQAVVSVDLVDASAVASARLDVSPLAGSAGVEAPLLRTPDGRWMATLNIPANAPHGAMDLALTATDFVGNEGLAGSVRLLVDSESPSITATSVSDVAYTTATVTVTTDEQTKAWHGNGAAPARDDAWLLRHALQVSGLIPGQNQQVTVRVMDRAGNTYSTNVQVSTDDDNAPPSNVTGLQSTSPSEGVVVLSWGAATDNAGVASYRIGRSFAPDVSVAADAERMHRDEGAPAGQAVTYRVAAVDVAGNVGPASEVTVQVLALPRLSNATVTPLTGLSHEPFTFQVDYSHASGAPADLVTVTVRGAVHALELIGAPGGDCRGACVYRARVLLPPTSLFDAPSGVTFRAVAGDHQDSLILEEGPVVRRSGQSGGIFDVGAAESESMPGIGALATFIILALAAVLLSRHQRRTQ